MAIVDRQQVARGAPFDPSQGCVQFTWVDRPADDAAVSGVGRMTRRVGNRMLRLENLAAPEQGELRPRLAQMLSGEIGQPLVADAAVQRAR